MKRWKWWHGALFLAGIGVMQGALMSTVRERQNGDLYKKARLPKFAPPQAAFPIAWAANAVSLTAGLIRALNLPPEREGRDAYIRWQMAGWALFVLFNPVYFGLRSPINAAAITLLYAIATAESAAIALSDVKDVPVSCSLATTCGWLCLAVPLSVAQAAMNRDEFWGAGPLFGSSES